MKKDYEVLASFFLTTIIEKVAIRTNGRIVHEGNSGNAVSSSGSISR
jgi:hypothetical protein